MPRRPKSERELDSLPLGGGMGRIVEFSLARRIPREVPEPARAGPAKIIILPVVRIEREATSPAALKKNLRNSTRKRRKRAPAATRRSG
jgi:hypothetical protein